MPRGRAGHGLTNEVSLAVPPGALAYWADRLAALGVATDAPEVRFGEPALPFADPSGLRVALVETGDDRPFTPWDASPVPPEFQVRGLHAVRLDVRDLAPTARFLDAALGHTRVATEGDTRRYAVGGAAHSGALVDLRETPGAARGMWGVGSVHHVAFRTPDDASELEAQQQVHAAGGRPTEVIDRFWFHSIYFREPGGALFEIATDGPGSRSTRTRRAGRAAHPAPFLEGGARRSSACCRRWSCPTPPRRPPVADRPSAPARPRRTQRATRTPAARCGRRRRPPRARAAVVLVHGRGASADDILGLGAALGVPGVALVAPQAEGGTWYPHSFLAPLAANEPGLSSGSRGGARARRGGRRRRARRAHPARRLLAGGLPRGGVRGAPRPPARAGWPC
jgi:glyoxalase family protein